MGESFKTIFGRRATEVARALSRTRREMDIPDPGLVQAGDLELAALPCDEETLRSAKAHTDTLKTEGSEAVTVGRGLDFWRARPGLVKFEALQAMAAAYCPTPQICGVAAPMQGFGAGLVSVFVPFGSGEDAPAITTELSGSISEEHPVRNEGDLTLHWGDGSVDRLIWADGLEVPLFRHGEFATDAALLHLRYDDAGTLQTGTALDGSWCEGPGAEKVTLPVAD